MSNHLPSASVTQRRTQDVERGRRAVGAKRLFQEKYGEQSELQWGSGELSAKPIGYQYRLANLTNFEKVQDS